MRPCSVSASLAGMTGVPRLRPLVLASLVGLLLVGAPLGTAAAASPTVRLSILHTVHGCHVWMTTKIVGASAKLSVRPGTRVVVRPLCPMDFDFVQQSGPRLALGNPRTLRGQTRTIGFTRRGVYRLVVRSVQTPAEVGLQTLGPTNVLRLTVVVR
jgi:hypothetical protein